MSFFVGRAEELDKLNSLTGQGTARLAVVMGRRRIGKSRLVFEFARGKRLLHFSGLTPEEDTTMAHQLRHFAVQFRNQLGGELQFFPEWDDAFLALANAIDDRETVVFFDEISWMFAGSSLPLAYFKTWWDLKFSQNPRLVFILCGSVSTWIEKNVLNSTGFVGRISKIIVVRPLSLAESAELLKSRGFILSPAELYTLLSIAGCIPWYLEQVDIGRGVRQWIKESCFQPEGFLLREFQVIFHDLFNGELSRHRRVVELLAKKMATAAEVAAELAISEKEAEVCLQNLVTAGFVSGCYQWDCAKREKRDRSLYRVSDPYLRTYLNIIAPHKEEILNREFVHIDFDQIPGIDTHIGLQVEHLLLSVPEVLIQAVGLPLSEWAYAGSYRQIKTADRAGCQIDFLVHSKADVVYVCEFKFKRGPITTAIIPEMRRKIDSLSLPSTVITAPILFCLGEATPALEESRFFHKIIDICQFLKL